METKLAPLNKLCRKHNSSLRLKDVVNGEEGPYPVYGASGIVGHSSSYQFDREYVAVVKDGAGVGRVLKCEANSSVLGTLQPIVPIESVNRDYLFSVLETLDLAKYTSGSTIPHIYFKDYGRELVPCLDHAEQNLLASRFETVNLTLDACNTCIEKCDSLVKSRFIEMFGSGRWPSKTIGELAIDIRYGTSKKASGRGKYIYLRMNNITDDGKLTYDDIKFIDLPEDELEKCQVVDSDLLFNRTNSREKVGKTAAFHGKIPMVIAGYIIRVRLGEEMRADYLSAFMNLSTTKAMLRSISKGTVHQANINSKELAAIEVPTPPIELQDHFLDFVSQVDKLRFDVQRQIEQLETLKKSLMQEYFG